MHDERMKGFRPYVGNLERLVESLLKKRCAIENHRRISESLNGQPAAELRSSVPLANRRADGVFFTGAKLARRVASKLISEIPASAVITDVGCGAGDLLLACASKLPLGSDLDRTLQIWGRHLMGFDIHPEFIRATKERLVLLAISRGVKVQNASLPEITEIFPMVREQDFLSCPREVAKASHIIINPPYNELIASSDCAWGSRKVSAAAVFMDACISNASPGTRICAILPDVLRSGSNYEKWRQRIESLSERVEITTCGQFDKWTDIHVFILKLEKDRNDKKGKVVWWKSLRQAHNGKVEDYFDVHVGPVVPHRHRKEGRSVAYVHANSLPPWEKVERINEHRRFSGTLFEPPFVVVRRTSRPGEKRAVGTIIVGNRKVAVENHLIALLPNRKTITECKELLRVLKSPETDKWLDERIRCRHLTVQSIKGLPWWGTKL